GVRAPRRHRGRGGRSGRRSRRRRVSGRQRRDDAAARRGGGGLGGLAVRPRGDASRPAAPARAAPRHRRCPTIAPDDRWQTLLTPGRAHARRLVETLRVGAFAGAAVDAAAADAYSLATLALLMGVEEIAAVAHTVDRALAYLPVAPSGRQAPLGALI